MPAKIPQKSTNTRLNRVPFMPGTVILTGTPHGVGMARTPSVFMKDGDSVSVEIEKIGTLTNPVKDES